MFNGNSVGILLVGFNRPELIAIRLKELAEISVPREDIFVSIDGPRENNAFDIVKHRDLRQICKRFGKNFIVRDKNFGCDKHIPMAISEILENYEFIIVIEDDISFAVNGIEEFIRLANTQKGSTSPFVAVSMSGLPTLFSISRNAWRKTFYFSAWGYMLNKCFWNLHQETFSTMIHSNLEESLSARSKIWNHWNNRKRYIWSERFRRGNYDYQIQRTMCLFNIEAVAPIIRIADNQGHSNPDAIHTRFKAPWYLKYPVTNKIISTNMGFMERRIPLNLLKWLDSQTWAGDGFLSKRGRTTGFRTILRKIAKVPSQFFSRPN